MPPDSRTIDEEGVLHRQRELLVDEGRFREAEMRAILRPRPYPARNVDRNISDLKAQLAACVRGRGAWRGMVAHYRPADVRRALT